MNGGDGNDFVAGGEDNDTVFGSDGSDYLDGGEHTDPGGDTLTYENVGRVSVTIKTPGDAGNPTVFQAEGTGVGGAWTDEFLNFESVLLTLGSDVLGVTALPVDIGGTKFDALSSDDGPDAGDTIDLSAAAAGGSGALVELKEANEAGTLTFSGQQIEVLNFENVIGSPDADDITGNGAQNRLAGGEGADILRIGGRNDTEAGGPDIIWGGAGADQIYVSYDQGVGGATVEANLPANLGILAIRIDGLTNESFTSFSLGDLGLGPNFNWDAIDLVLVNPDPTDEICRVQTFEFEGEVFEDLQRLGTVTVDNNGEPRELWDYSGGNVETVTFLPEVNGQQVASWDFLDPGNPAQRQVQAVFGPFDSPFPDPATLRPVEIAEWFILGAEIHGDAIVVPEGQQIKLTAGDDTAETPALTMVNDAVLGSGGADSYDGLGGIDQVSYSISPGAVTVSLAAGTGSGGHAEGDTLISIEAVRGSGFNDGLFGDAGANLFAGNAGDDFIAGEAGDDVLDGGEGADQIFGGAGADIIGGGAGGDTLAGGEGTDRLAGDDGFDFLAGGSGNDELYAGLGNDVLRGGAATTSSMARTATIRPTSVMARLALPRTSSMKWRPAPISATTRSGASRTSAGRGSTASSLPSATASTPSTTSTMAPS